MTGTLCDTGPLVALIDAEDSHHQACIAALPALPAPLVTTWPCITEAMYLLHRVGGWSCESLLWEMMEAGALDAITPTDAERHRMRALMGQYRDTPMDLADASLVAAAESLDTLRVFTVDTDFRVYRAHGNRPFDIVP